MAERGADARGARTRGRLLASGLAVGAIVIGLMAPMAPASATDAPVAAPASTDASTLPIQLGSPWHESLDARWNWLNAAPLPSTTRTLSVTIPPELFEFGSPITALIVGARRDPVTVISADAATRTVSVDIPAGYLATAAPSMTTGSPRWSLVLQTSRPAQAGVLAAPYFPVDGATEQTPSTGYLSIGFDPGPPGPTEHSRTVEVSGASHYWRTREYWVDPKLGLTAHPGDTLTIAGGPQFDKVSYASLIAISGNTVPVTTVPTAGPGLSATIPAESDLAPLVNRSMQLRIQASEAQGFVEIGVPFTLLHTPTDGPGDTTRLAGYDRYGGAIAYSQAQFPPGAAAHPATLAVTSGEKFADSLGAAAAVAHVGGALLLAPPDAGTYFAAYTESTRLGPSNVFSIGGPASVSPQTELDVAAAVIGSSHERIDGADRYDVSRNTAQRFWPGGASTIFIATGQTFPDALAAVPAAATQQAPVLLVPGTGSALDAATLATLGALRPQHLVIVGGPVSVSPGIERQLATLYPGGVERVTGADRYEVSTAVNTRFFPAAQEAFLATGANFPDALTGGVLAASKHAPLLLVRPDCVPASAHAALVAWNVERTTLLGGPNSLGTSIENLVPCS